MKERVVFVRASRLKQLHVIRDTVIDLLHHFLQCLANIVVAAFLGDETTTFHPFSEINVRLVTRERTADAAVNFGAGAG